MPDPPVRKHFGTDGVRGVAGDVLTAQLALSIGRAATLEVGGERPRVLVIRDTRESGDMLEAALAAGIASAGGDVLLGGVLPTPAAPLLIERYGLDLAAVISASHNPFEDNGIKFFGADSFKLSDATELAIEARMEAPRATRRRRRIGSIRELHGTREDYLRALAGALRRARPRRRLASRSTARTARPTARRPRSSGASAPHVTVLADAPDGRNINDGCGSTHPEALVAAMREGGHDIGFAFDGDGDRMLAVDRTGALVDGDELIALAALHLRAQDRLPGGGVVVTVMTNYGFHTAMRAAGIEVATTQVGDRYVLEELRERGWGLGGEQSGHIIDMGFVPSGDGIASALLTLEALAGSDLAERHAMDKLPQRLVNVRVPDRDAAMASAELAAAAEAEGAALEGRGRVLVRPSGTEQLVRVMVEAPSHEETDAVCARLVAIVEAEASSAARHVHAGTHRHGGACRHARRRGAVGARRGALLLRGRRDLRALQPALHPRHRGVRAGPRRLPRRRSAGARRTARGALGRHHLRRRAFRRPRAGQGPGRERERPRHLRRPGARVRAAHGRPRRRPAAGRLTGDLESRPCSDAAGDAP